MFNSRRLSIILLSYNRTEFHTSEWYNGDHACLILGDYPLFFYLTEWPDFTHLSDNGDHACLKEGDYSLFFYPTGWVDFTHQSDKWWAHMFNIRRLSNILLSYWMTGVHPSEW